MGNAGVISPTPAKIGTIIVTPDGDDDRSDIILYDGESANDPRLIQLRTGAGISQVFNFQPYLETHRGLYVTFEHHVKEILVQLMWEAE